VKERTEEKMAVPFVEGVLDLTFYNISDENSLNAEINNKITFLTTAVMSPKRTASPVEFNNTSGTGSPSSPKSRFKKKNVKAIRLGNNEIQTTAIFSVFTAHFDTTKILWLDLSFNMIQEISNDFVKLFPQITTIYLQSNQISKLSEVKKFGELEHLRSLALYGNPVEENKHYRNYIIYFCKHLHQFDKSPVTKQQAELVSYIIFILLRIFQFLLVLFFCLFLGGSMGSNFSKEIKSS
jgi:hypothetical protein